MLLQVRGRRRRDWPEDETGREVRKNGTDSLEGLQEQHYISQVGVGKYDHISVESTVFTLRGGGSSNHAIPDANRHHAMHTLSVSFEVSGHSLVRSSNPLHIQDKHKQNNLESAHETDYPAINELCRLTLAANAEGKQSTVRESCYNLKNEIVLFVRCG